MFAETLDHRARVIPASLDPLVALATLLLVECFAWKGLNRYDWVLPGCHCFPSLSISLVSRKALYARLLCHYSFDHSDETIQFDDIFHLRDSCYCRAIGYGLSESSTKQPVHQSTMLHTE